jgi:hypothetical protein
MPDTDSAEDARSDELRALRIKAGRYKAEIAAMSRALERKNRELDALHMVWCDGACSRGVHRWQGPNVLVTEELVKTAERNTERLRRWYDGAKFRYETYGPNPSKPWNQFPTTRSEWHRDYALKAAVRTDLVGSGETQDVSWRRWWLEKAMRILVAIWSMTGHHS